MGIDITIARRSGAAALAVRVQKLTKTAAYVGIPAANKDKRKGGKKKLVDVNNAELLFLFEHGVPLRKQPARRVLGPAVEADGNKQAIAAELKSSISAVLEGKNEIASKRMMRVALAGQNASRKWFTDPRNDWAPNAPRTIKAKGSDRPGIDTGAMRAAIIGVVRQEE